MLEKKFIPLNLQFFADNLDDESQDENEKTDDEGGAEDKSKKSDKTEKTFTQAQVNKMMSREKKEGKNSVLSSLGFKTEEEAKKAVELYNALINSQKSDEEKQKEQLSQSENLKSEAEKRAVDAENKLACIMAGVNKESVDDVLAIASLKIDDKNDLSKVLEKMRSEAKYAIFFEESDESNKDTGTGHDTSHSRRKSDDKKGSYGARLANTSKDSKKKSSYFNS
jgi:hypothetical protein